MVFSHSAHLCHLIGVFNLLTVVIDKVVFSSAILLFVLVCILSSIALYTEAQGQPEVRVEDLLRSFLDMHTALDMRVAF